MLNTLFCLFLLNPPKLTLGRKGSKLVSVKKKKGQKSLSGCHSSGVLKVKIIIFFKETKSDYVNA